MNPNPKLEELVVELHLLNRERERLRAKLDMALEAYIAKTVKAKVALERFAALKEKELAKPRVESG